jgi:hypothetical protein
MIKTRKSPTPFPLIPDLVGKLASERGWNPQSFPDLAGNRVREIPVSRFSRERESGPRARGRRAAGGFLVWGPHPSPRPGAENP